MKNYLKQIIIAIVLIATMISCSPSEKPLEVKLADPVPLEDFFKDPQRAGYDISPNGEYILFRAPHKGRMNVYVQKLGDTTSTAITHETERSIPFAFWEDDNTIIYSKDFGGDENFHVLSVNRDGSNQKDLTPWTKVRSGVLDILKDRPGELLIESNKRNAEIFDVYLVNINSGNAKLVAQNPGNITGWITDHNGKIRAAVTTDGVNSSLLFRDNEKDKFKTVITTSFKETLYPYLFTFDNKNLYCVSNLGGRDKIALVEYDPRTAKEISVVYENPDADIDGVDYSKKRKVLTAVYFEREKAEKHFLDSTTEATYKNIGNQIPNYIAQITSTNKAEDKFLIYCRSDRYNGGTYFFDDAAKKLEKLSDARPWLKEENMAEMKPIQYTSRDGLTIHGYLTIPKGLEPKNLPVVINPHGGPWARDVWRFNSEVQFLANRGYAVLQMNFRGSTGYGRKFWESSFKQWGRTMQDDVTDGVKWLIKEGIADSTRVGIYGGSYGGYTTLAGITLTPELYACAVDYVGVANMFTFMNTIPPYWEPYRKMFYEMVGDPKKDSLMLAEVSPVFHVDKIRCPLLVAQGANDPRVNKDESDQMVDALRKRGITVEYIVKNNEGHGFSNQENKFEFYGAMEKFFENNLKKPVPDKRDM